MLKKLLGVLLFSVAVILPVFFAIADNIENGDSIANLEIDDTDVLFACDGCNVDVSDTEINGLIWGESLGWVNLQPSDGGVFNTRLGVVSGTAWGSVSGWVNFEGVFIDPENGEFSGEAFSQNRGPITFECPGSSCVITTWRPYGCTNENAQNYDYTATVDDGSCQVIFDPLVPGCTDPEASNYNPTAELDDGSCQYEEEIPGCTDPEATNFNPLATLDDGSCSFISPTPDDPDNPNPGGGGDDPDIFGCTDPVANNFNPFATIDNGSCLFGSDIPGCMDPESPLFNPDATVEDANACFIDFYGCMDPDATNFDPGATIHNNTCTYVGTIGCTDILALNFNPTATTDNGSCVYDSPMNGCTNPLALNYNPEATIENNTCFFSIEELVGEEPDEDPGEDPENGEDDEILPGEDAEDNPNNTNPAPGGGQEFIEEFFGGMPGGVGQVGVSVNKYIATKTGTAKALAVALLIASLIQTLPFREGNLLFSFFSFYKTRKYWGTVYDSVTKQPLDPAYVTLFDEAGQAIDTSITDIDGRYSFVVGPGTYFLSAQKTDYQFPSQKLKDKLHDEIYTHLYFGGAVELKNEDEVISRNIPMDPLRFNWNEYAKQKTKVTHFYRPWHRTINFLAKVLFAAGFVFAIWVFTVSPSLFSFVILSLYILTVVLKLLGLRKIPRGYVKDKHGFALSFGVIRVYSQKLKREVKHTIIGAGGHYLLLVPNGRYYMTVEQKLPDGTYQEVYKTGSFRVRKGFIAKKIKIHQDLVVTPEEKFDSAFGGGQQKTA